MLYKFVPRNLVKVIQVNKILPEAFAIWNKLISQLANGVNKKKVSTNVRLTEKQKSHTKYNLSNCQIISCSFVLLLLAN
jgi:hypothetical protein